MKILEQNGIEIENIDGAAFNHFCAAKRSGILPCILDECPVLSASSNSVTVGTGELLISGFRIKLTEAITFTFSASPVADTQYYIIATIDVHSDRSVSFDLSCLTDETLETDNIFSSEEGTYQLEIGRFVHKTNGSVSDVSRTAVIIDGENVLQIGSTTITEAQLISLLNLLS